MWFSIHAAAPRIPRLLAAGCAAAVHWIGNRWLPLVINAANAQRIFFALYFVQFGTLLLNGQSLWDLYLSALAE